MLHLGFSALDATAVLLASLRAYAWLSLVPPFSGTYIPKAARTAAAVGLGVAVGPRLHLAAVPGLPALLLDGADQVVVGAAFGLLVSFLLAAIPAAGDTLALFGGLSLPPALVPIGYPAATTIGQLYGLLMAVLLIVSGGDLLLLRGFMTSFIVTGPTIASLHPLAHAAIGELSTFFAATIEVAGPLLVVEFMVQVGLGLIAKAAPQVNVFLFSFSVQILVLVLGLAVAVAVLPSAVAHIVGLILHVEGGLL